MVFSFVVVLFCPSISLVLLDGSSFVVGVCSHSFLLVLDCQGCFQGLVVLWMLCFLFSSFVVLRLCLVPCCFPVSILFFSDFLS